MASLLPVSDLFGPRILAQKDRPALSAWQLVRNRLVRWRQPILATAVALLAARRLLAGTEYRFTVELPPACSVLGLVLMVCGMVWRSWGAGVVHKNRALATHGPYAVCRHPLYLGSIVVTAGFCLLTGDLAAALVLALPFLAIHVLRMWREEETLAARFGAAYARYAASVPRLLPVHWPAGLRAEWSWSQWCRNREARTLAHVILGLAALLVWRWLL